MTQGVEKFTELMKRAPTVKTINENPKTKAVFLAVCRLREPSLAKAVSERSKVGINLTRKILKKLEQLGVTERIETLEGPICYYYVVTAKGKIVWYFITGRTDLI